MTIQWEDNSYWVSVMLKRYRMDADLVILFLVPHRARDYTVYWLNYFKMLNSTFPSLNIQIK